ncbi:MAG: tetratricopeptide repeat protein, partial [Calditrichaeota bacterium]|nr:tetratricopeptide repeat protein [Calditrichota bacterium]
MDDETKSTKLEKARHLDLEVLKLYQNKRYQTAIDSSTVALQLYTDVFGENHLEVATTYQNIAEFQFNLRKYAAALQNLENALRIREKLLPKNHLLIAETQRKLGLLKSRLGEFGAADSLYQHAYRSILVTRKQYHPDMRPLAEDLRNL